MPGRDAWFVRVSSGAYRCWRLASREGTVDAVPSSLDGPLCSPGGYATTHTLDIQHALGEALAHERFG